MSFINDVLSKFGAVVDAAVPVAQGNRTKIAALIAVLVPLICSLLESKFPGACAALAPVAGVSAASVPVFAVAGLVRK